MSFIGCSTGISWSGVFVVLLNWSYNCMSNISVDCVSKHSSSPSWASFPSRQAKTD